MCAPELAVGCGVVSAMLQTLRQYGVPSPSEESAVLMFDCEMRAFVAGSETPYL
jgi:hypothetical protein